MAKDVTEDVRHRHSPDTIRKIRIAALEREISPDLTQKRREARAKSLKKRVKLAGWTLDPDFDEDL